MGYTRNESTEKGISSKIICGILSSQSKGAGEGRQLVAPEEGFY